jgi:type III restriction enzyme
VQQSEQLEIYLDGERIRYGQAKEPQLSLNAVPTVATENDLVLMLAQQARSIYVSPIAMRAYVSRLIAHLTRERGHSLTGLVRAQFQLSQQIIARVEIMQAKARALGFQQLLFGTSESALAMSPNWMFEFKAGSYPSRNPYSGSWRFDKHYFPVIADLKAQGEEFDCAKVIDRHVAVRHWVRNLSQLPQFAFWLPTATDNFYPDFVLELLDGRLAAIEYKGEAYATNDDSREKRLVGERWAQTTGQLFAMVELQRNGMGIEAQLNEAFRA